MTSKPQIVRGHVGFRNWLVLAVFSLIATSVHSQLTSGTILGTVTDASSALLRGAKITATNLDTGFTRTATTDSAGNYQLAQMPLGRYQIRAEAPNFTSALRGPVELIVDQKLRSDFQLKVGNVSEIVEVHANETLLVTDQHDVSQIVQEREIKQLPLNGRDFFSLLLLSNGIQDTSTDQGGATTNVTFSVNGMRPESNSVTLDGIEMSSIRESDVDLRPNLDAVSEFKVLTSAYSAEYGHTAGGVISIQSKAGTNAFHGSAFEFLRNEGLNARNYFINGAKPPLKQNTFGGTFGGPIIRDKTFFFLDYQGYILHTVNEGYTTVPELPFRSGDFSSLLPPGNDCSIANPPAYQGGDPSQPVSSCIYDPASFNPSTGSIQQVQDPSRSTPNNPQGLNIIPASEITPFGSYLLNSIAEPNGNFPLGNFLTHQRRRFHQSDAGLRVDHTFSAKDSVFARYRWNQSWLDDANPLARTNDGPSPGLNGAMDNTGRGIPQGGTHFDRNNNLVLSWIHVFNPAVLNELHTGFHRYRLSVVGHEQDQNLAENFGLHGINTLGSMYSGLPALYLNAYNNIGGTDFKPLHFHETSAQVMDNISYRVGLHTMKAGFEFRPRYENNYYALFPSGAFYFFPVRTSAPCTLFGSPCSWGPSYWEGHELAEILTGNPFESWVGRRFSSAMLRDNQYSFFVQDDWKPTKRLTLNLGVRYEYASPFYSPHNQMSMFDLNQQTLLIAGQNGVSQYIVNTDKNNWAPRVGFAYQVNQKTTVRGGFGMFYDPANAFRDDIKFNPPFYRQIAQVDDFSSVAPSNWNFSSSGPPALTDPGSRPTGYDLFNVDRNFRIGYTDQYSLAVQRELPWQTLLETAYVGSQGHLLPFRINVNQVQPNGTPAPFPDLGQIPVVRNIGTMTYHSGQLKLEKRFSNNLFFLGSYTYSHSIDDVTSSELDAVGVQNIFDIRQNRGNSDWDIRHRLAFSYLYNLPFGRGQFFLGNADGITNAILGGWQTSGLLVLSSGQPFTVVDGSTIPGGDARPDLVGDPFAPGPSCPQPGTPECWFNPAAFQPRHLDPNDPSSPVVAGNEGRNSLRAPGYRNFDLGLIKIIPLTESTRLQFRGEFFNLSNTPHFAIPANGLNDPNVGQLTHTRNSTNFGSSATSYGNRIIQLALKLEF
jgi:outer membrane receptor protein involved in Fe transport